MKKNSSRKPSVKVKDLHAGKNPKGGETIKIKFTTTTKDKVDTLAPTPQSSVKIG